MRFYKTPSRENDTRGESREGNVFPPFRKKTIKKLDRKYTLVYIVVGALFLAWEEY